MIEFSLSSEMERWYSTNWNNPTAQGSWKMCNVYSAPDTSAEIAGSIYSEYSREIQNFILYFRPEGSEELVVWNDSIGDWGYGIHTYSPETSENFVRLLPNPFPENSWVQIDTKSKDALKGYTESLVGRLIHIQKMNALNLTTQNNMLIEQGNYMVLKFTGDTYLIRPEIPTDMPCGEEEIGEFDDSMVVRYQVKFEKLVDKENKPRFKLAYPKGC